MLPNNVPTSYPYDLRHLASWITDNTNDDPITMATGRLLEHIAHGYGGLQCDGIHGVDKYMRREGGYDHERLIKLGEYVAVATVLNHHAPRPELRTWQTRIGYGGRLLAGAAWLKDCTSPNDQVGRSIAKLLDYIAEQYQDITLNGRHHHQQLIKLAKQTLFAVIVNYPRQQPVDPEQEALDFLRAQLGAAPVSETQR